MEVQVRYDHPVAQRELCCETGILKPFAAFPFPCVKRTWLHEAAPSDYRVSPPTGCLLARAFRRRTGGADPLRHEWRPARTGREQVARCLGIVSGSQKVHRIEREIRRQIIYQVAYHKKVSTIAISERGLSARRRANCGHLQVTKPTRPAGRGRRSAAAPIAAGIKALKRHS